jgi:YbbR domain-containing protein
MEGEGQMNEMFRKDITIKTFSVVLAMLLWLYVLNIKNPYEDRKINIELKFENEEYLAYNDLKLTNKINKNLEISVRGRSDIVRNILPSDFEATIDFSNIRSVNDNTIKINLEYNLKDVIVNMSHSSVKVKLENIITASFPVEIELRGNPKENYKIINKRVSPETIEFKDIESLVNTINAVKVIVDVPKDLDRDFAVHKECIVYNESGEVIVDLSRNLNAEVVVEVAKEVPITLVTTGTLAEEHVEIAREVNPDKALVRGSHDLLSKIDEIRTEPLSIDNADTSINTPIALSLPEGINLINTPNEVTTSISIEKLEDKNFTIGASDINLLNTSIDPSFVYTINTAEVEFGIRGRKANLENINLMFLKPRIDVEDLEEGTHKVPLIVNLPPDSRFLDIYEVEVIVSKNEEYSKE